MTCSYDANFNLLWGLNNNANPALDINACQAWQISHGTNIKVAVVDQGIYLSHPDLNSNIGGIGYDAQSEMIGSVYNPIYSHGTHVAGVIAAERNNQQVVGVTPLSKIIPISHDLTGGTIPSVTNANISAQLASGITWAWEMENVDIINNSWGAPGVGAGSILYSPILEDAINDALVLGRDGKGCVVVFSAGNSGNVGANMYYPANSHDRIMTVGAITKLGARWFKSSYGAKLDVVAPGQGIWTTTPTSGIREGDGTSLAAPHVSGVAALILSVNPCLTGQQVIDIIEQTSQKIRTDVYTYTNTPNKPNGTWNEQMGYGLVDAYAAVLMAKSLLTTNPCEPDIQEPLQLSTLETIAPNPANNNINVNYILREANAASLLIVSQTGNNSAVTINLDLNATQININVGNYLPGLYTIALIVNENVVDSKILIKQ